MQHLEVSCAVRILELDLCISGQGAIVNTALKHFKYYKKRMNQRALSHSRVRLRKFMEDCPVCTVRVN